MPPATFTLGNTLFQMEQFHFYLWLFYRLVGLLTGPRATNDLFLPPLSSPSRTVVRRVEGRVRFTLRSTSACGCDKQLRDVTFLILFTFFSPRASSPTLDLFIYKINSFLILLQKKKKEWFSRIRGRFNVKVNPLTSTFIQESPWLPAGVSVTTEDAKKRHSEMIENDFVIGVSLISAALNLIIFFLFHINKW